MYRFLTWIGLLCIRFVITTAALLLLLFLVGRL